MSSGTLLLVGERAARLQRRRVERVERVRRHRRRDQRVALALRDERARCAPGLRPASWRRRTGNWMIVWPRTPRRPASLRRRGDLLLEVVHVGVGGRARLDHLERGQPRAGRARTPATPSWPRPGRCTCCSQSISARSSASPRIQHHRRVRVRVDQARHARPGRRASMRLARAGSAAAIAAGGVDADDVARRRWRRRPARARAGLPSTVTTVPLVTTSDTRAAWPGAWRGGDRRRGSTASTRRRRASATIVGDSASPATRRRDPRDILWRAPCSRRRPPARPRRAADAARRGDAARHVPAAGARISLLLAAEATARPARRVDGTVRRRSARPTARRVGDRGRRGAGAAGRPRHARRRARAAAAGARRPHRPAARRGDGDGVAVLREAPGRPRRRRAC